MQPISCRTSSRPLDLDRALRKVSTSLAGGGHLVAADPRLRAKRGFCRSCCSHRKRPVHAWAVRHGNIAVAGIRLPLPIAKGKLPVLISSNLSHVDKRGWRLLRAPHWESFVDLLFLQLPEAVTNVWESAHSRPPAADSGFDWNRRQKCSRKSCTRWMRMTCSQSSRR